MLRTVAGNLESKSALDRRRELGTYRRSIEVRISMSEPRSSRSCTFSNRPLFGSVLVNTSAGADRGQLPCSYFVLSSRTFLRIQARSSAFVEETRDEVLVDAVSIDEVAEGALVGSRGSGEEEIAGNDHEGSLNISYASAGLLSTARDVTHPDQAFADGPSERARGPLRGKVVIVEAFEVRLQRPLGVRLSTPQRRADLMLLRLGREYQSLCKTSKMSRNSTRESWDALGSPLSSIHDRT